MADNRPLADIARKGGGKLLNAAIDAVLPVDGAKLAARKKTVLDAIAGTVALRVATRSVPGAIMVGGALLAKRIYDKRRQKSATKDAGKAQPKA